jgi:RNAse (barnase) inhibitor barstar
MTLNDSSVLMFKAISSFIHDLNEIYGNSQKSLCLYAALIEKTGLVHEEPIKKHIKCFHDFVVENDEGIINKDIQIFNTHIIRYSEKVFIDLKDIFKLAEKNVSDIQEIWKHLLTLSALMNPVSQAKKVLQTDQEKEQNTEDNFLSGLIDKIGKHVDPSSSNPMESMSSLMSSGVFNEIMTSMNDGINDGKLDMQSMVGGLQKMIGSLSDMIQTPQQDT